MFCYFHSFILSFHVVCMRRRNFICKYGWSLRATAGEQHSNLPEVAWGSMGFKSTWCYENRVNRRFVIFLNFPCLRAWHMFTVLLAYVFLFFLFLFFARFVVRDLCRSGCRQNYYLPPPPPDFFSLPTILSLTQVTVIWNQRAPKAGFGAV